MLRGRKTRDGQGLIGCCQPSQPSGRFGALCQPIGLAALASRAQRLQHFREGAFSWSPRPPMPTSLGHETPARRSKRKGAPSFAARDAPW